MLIKISLLLIITSLINIITNNENATNIKYETLINNTNQTFSAFQNFTNATKINLTYYEVDKFMACKELTGMIYINDQKTIDESFEGRNDSMVVYGIQTVMYGKMIENCYNNINDTLINLIYHNYTRDLKIEDIDDSEIDYIRVNYTHYGRMKQFNYTHDFGMFLERYRIAQEEYLEHNPKEKEKVLQENERKKKAAEERRKRRAKLKCNNNFYTYVFEKDFLLENNDMNYGEKHYKIKDGRLVEVGKNEEKDGNNNVNKTINNTNNNTDL